MTHDELLVEIDIQLRHLPSYFNAGDKTIAGMKALRAIVELHPPIYDNSCSDADCCGGPYPDLCNGCGDDYPCSTIQAIEKELG